MLQHDSGLVIYHVSVLTHVPTGMRSSAPKHEFCCDLYLRAASAALGQASICLPMEVTRHTCDRSRVHLEDMTTVSAWCTIKGHHYTSLTDLMMPHKSAKSQSVLFVVSVMKL